MRSLWVVAAVVTLAGAAHGEERRLTAGEIKKDWFGIVMSGVTREAQERWTECIEPDGDTVYTHQGRPLMRGKMWTQAGDLVCFAYEDTEFLDSSCFSAWTRNGKTEFRAEPAAPGDDVFEVRRIQRNVKSCPKPSELIG